MNLLDSRPAHVPLSTYRLQFNLNFGFRDAARLLPYLEALGISDLYASPYLQARPGSLHGYDISNHNRLNPEIGSEEEHEALTADLRRRGMGHLLDIVPNHMGIGQDDNTWWMDVLENGPSSIYAPFFDIDWEPVKPELTGKVLLPVLGDQYGRVLERGELRLAYHDSRFRIEYFDRWFPIAPRSAALVLRRVLERLSEERDEHDLDRTELESIVRALENLPHRSRTDSHSVAERRRENVVSRRRVAALHEGSPAFRRALEATLEEVNGTPGDPHSFDTLAELLDDQAYRLSYWRVAAEEINYRRFFDINELAGVRVERPEVFEATHRLILRLVEEGRVTALRIDHPDGLYDPRQYLRALQAECTRRLGGSPVYLLVEKILTGDEPLADDWPVAGTVGYDFLNRVNGLFVDGGAEAEMTATYFDFLGERQKYTEMAYERKLLILRVSLASELNVLSFLLDRISESNRRYRDFTLGALTNALRELIASFPVYRTYIEAHEQRISERDREHVERAYRLARRRNPATSRSVFDFIRSVLLLEWPEDLNDEAYEAHARFVMKFQQLTGPVMAKGVEDTSFYLYNRLVSLNEVGGEPQHFGVSAAELHRWLEARRERWPLAMNASSTHDTKRSEDVRARIHVLSEIPEEWARRVRHWEEINAPAKLELDGEHFPDPNTEYLLYQTLVGAWPLEPLTPEVREEFVDRVQRYMEKATREAKVHTSWINPNEDYDHAVRQFVGSVLAPGPDGSENMFVADMVGFQKRIEVPGMLNALSQTLVKLTAPGVPDVYQGQEMWDLSLVDPDNRRPVDFEARAARLQGIQDALAATSARAVADDLLRAWRDGGIKLYLTHRVLELRRDRPDLFLEGDYVPLQLEGPQAERAFAFARIHGRDVVVVIAPRLQAALLEPGAVVPGGEAWGETYVTGPAEVLGRAFHHLLTGAAGLGPGEGQAPRLPVRDLLDGFPVAVLVAE